MNLDELRSVQSKERSKDSLQHLRESFYADVGSYVRGLREERERAAERADDPFDSAEVNRLTDEIQTAEEVVEAIYERRVGKVVKRASLSAAGIPADEDGLTTEEQTLFADLVQRIETNKSTVLDVLSGTEQGGSESETSTTAAASADSETTGLETNDPEPSEADDDRPVGEAAAVADDSGAPESSTPTTTEPRQSEETPTAETGDSRTAEETPSTDGATDDGDPSLGDDRTTVRITRDVGAILGVDEREYDLADEDVVTLPAENAGPLIERDAAEKLD